MADIPRSILVSRGPRRVAPQQAFFATNLLTTTLAPAGAVQAPFRQLNWPNPIRQNVTLARHFLEAVSYYTPPPIRPIDYQNPVRKRKVQQPDLVPNLVLNALYTPPPVPFIRFDWQNPVIKRKVQAPYQFQSLGQLTLTPDTTPDAFSFTDQTDVARSTVTTSAPITVAGIDAPTNISVTGGEYSINGGAFTSSPGIGAVVNGDQIRARNTSSGNYSTAVNTAVTIGGVSDTFTSTTVADVPVLLGQIPNLSEAFDSGTHTVQLGDYAANFTSVSISPAIEAGWTFNTTTGELVYDTDDEDTFGPYIVTFTNANGDTPGNAFLVTVADIEFRSGGWVGIRLGIRI